MLGAEHLAHMLTPGHGRTRDLALGMLPRGDPDLDLEHRLKGDDVRGRTAVSGEPLLLLLLGPHLLVHDWSPRLDGGHVFAPPSLRHIGFIRRSLESAGPFAGVSASGP